MRRAHQMTRTEQRMTGSARVFAAQRTAVVAGVVVSAALLLGAPQAFGQQVPYNTPIVSANPSLPDPGARQPESVQVPPTAAVAGIQVTTAAPTTAAPTTAVAKIVTVPASVLGVTIEEQVEDVAFTGSESSGYTATGVGLTAVGALLIGVTRRRRKSA